MANTKDATGPKTTKGSSSSKKQGDNCPSRTNGFYRAVVAKFKEKKFPTIKEYIGLLMAMENRKESETSSTGIIAEGMKLWAAEQPDVVDAVRTFTKELTMSDGKNLQPSADVKTTSRLKLYVVHPDDYENVAPHVKAKFADMEKRSAQKSTAGPAPAGKGKGKRVANNSIVNSRKRARLTLDAPEVDDPNTAEKKVNNTSGPGAIQTTTAQDNDAPGDDDLAASGDEAAPQQESEEAAQLDDEDEASDVGDDAVDE
ncbi:hypothetical protein MCOR29_008234 [Pyricularia oryzae]|uniref:Uncharacterized protein n=1 Tax=Pyricularia grisea TaxID=148305 RepID=A0ABQ8NMJ8_PYRGI|nr:hypothetical protein MCOR33_005706 [Pyricularia grisea]KAI6311660.1 hypothetical protein MCOR29_008234 [Pyricularia oryzae]KAI6487756.1 hypothetical protein MCOR11_008710 [Pyricularia oryzae]KAI6522024.1 hypothetical protein MCOR10_005758 [Pyricularia oryzae]KAI6544836.1 hypothetical protein MCOR05_002001 [Pyricularia oryzae]